jgi:hypothetical protein
VTVPSRATLAAATRARITVRSTAAGRYRRLGARVVAWAPVPR